ncbi:hypothetical protein [Nocardia amamiensis]|uniref:hypothetical protein n=1 Tax=Nocardia amamiensis TaxID=404578 RepID=UPI00082CB587|nr:hypothetical protein [Nocardia amamiensis]
MTTEHKATYNTLAERLISLGMISTDTAHRVLRDIDELDDDGLDNELDGEYLSDALECFGVAIGVHGDKVDDLEGSYEYLLRDAAACTGGAVVVDDVELNSDPDGGAILRFVCNGSVVEWSLQHDFDGYLDFMSILSYIGDLNPPGADDHRTFRSVELDEPGTNYYVLATDEQALALVNEFGLRLD